ncbi:RNA polymerase sigma factor [Paenibacillus sp. FSL M7-1455]|uniref:RNA polymerase sigma factor n=1 Tax=Paenibacillus cookii TaxID=157839 RepID=A0ABQ4LQP4_9BACL|nr:RNA polymerase sigma factor [Paenibacillus cookii]KHF32515.1 ECF RNA polymerase sigma factor SigW [Paenibacillus sp. P1XP2]GIO65328.1 DNA-directed RNA polymerase sigma-70 factor [Paenibacillus cookii]
MIRQLLHRGKVIKHYLVRIGANPSDAEEIVQDTLLKGITHIDSIKPAKFMSWLFKVATHKYYDLYRKETRRGKTVSFELLSFMDESSPEDRYLRKEKSLGVKELLNRIPQKYKQMLILKYDLGLSYDEIGRLLNVKTERVKTDLYRARNMFKKMYEGERQDEQ